MVLIGLVISFICCGIDLVFKAQIENGRIKEREFKKVPLKIRRMHNSGFLMNTLDEKPGLVQKMSLVITILLGFYQIFLLNSKKCIAAKVSGAIMLGGALSNLYDRIVRGYVVDYVSIKTKWEKVARIVFNVADVCIFLGGIGLVLFNSQAKEK